MQVRDNDTLLLYGLFQSICGWALEKGYRDIGAMKNLLKLAMIDACRKQHEEATTSASQMAVVADLGISLRNVQNAMKTMEELNKLSSGFVKIRQIHREILRVLSKQPQTLSDLLAEVAYLIHAPYDLQKRALRTILMDLEQKGMVTYEMIKGKAHYRAVESHVSLFDPSDMSARLSGLLSHVDAFKNTVGQPFHKMYRLDAAQAEGLARALHELLLGTGNAFEQDARNAGATTDAYYYYLGCTPIGQAVPQNLAETILQVVQCRFQDTELPSLARTHWYHLTPAGAQSVFLEVSKFLAREADNAAANAGSYDTHTFALYFGMAQRQSRMFNEGTPL